MIIDDYESIATAHARIFTPKDPRVPVAPSSPSTNDDKYTIVEMTEEEINNLLAAIRELIS